MSQLRVEIETLSVDERLDLLEEIWESLSTVPDAVPFTDAQRDELDRRLDDLEREGPVGMTWDEMEAKARGRRR